MATKQERIVLNGPFQQLTRTSAKGKKSRRVSIEIESEPLLHNFDDNMLGAGPAEAIKEAIAKGIRDVKQTVKPSTIARRKRSIKNPNTRSYKARYLGGRGTATQPQTGASRWLNDSTRFAKGLFVRQNKAQQTYTVNVPASRLNQDTWGTQGLPFAAFLAEVKRLVPALDPKRLQQMPGVEKAIQEGIGALIVKAKDLQKAKLESLKQARLQLLKTAAKLAFGG